MEDFLDNIKQQIVYVDGLPIKHQRGDNGEGLVSAGQSFVLGFFSPWNSNNHYVGIWFKDVPQQTVIWVANRDDQVTDSSGTLTITSTGNMFIHKNESTVPIWSSNSSTTSNNSVLKLLDTGNLVVKDANSDRRGEWVVVYNLQRDECDAYAKCGPNGICNVNKELYCRCPSGFTPKRPEDWNGFDWSGGCSRRIELNYSMRGHKRRQVQIVHNPNQGYDPGAGEEALDLPSFDMVTVATATNDYLFTNKIGAGGFGHVYKGKLPTGQEIAVKRLSKDSQQGLQEFKNEVILIAKLQHRNLVKLLGCCIRGEEKMLIYEYMHNRSLDFHLYNRAMNPKISDFGLARIFGADQTEANMTRVVGTYGYMSPEYAIEGLFLVKSDVFSFGVLVLEIISGKRKRGFYHSNHDMNLLGHAWKLWNEDKALQLGDALMEKSVTT
ncbi:Uncharacterized protein TCM_030039 [Theobroma cacao]|uniref:non-specific serine/threonine protein kinase n=1 Tax=Theobroma cacao TaxID=3641 RepID=A0A061GH48_THECC|nr:Uncharacterized protein TCM_030039 [Theobroma cacao]